MKNDNFIEKVKSILDKANNQEMTILYGDMSKYQRKIFDSHDKVFILYGLRRTGKTTLIRQIIYNMSDEDRNKTVFIQINPTNTLADVNKDLRKLETLGYKYVFIDEVTMMDDYIQGAALFSDVFASSGMKIVLSIYSISVTLPKKRLAYIRYRISICNSTADRKRSPR